MALSLGAVSALTSRFLKRMHWAVTNQAGANSSLATGDVVVTFDASDNYEPKYSTIAEVVGSGRTVALSDANASILAANSGKVHTIANVSADRTFTLPAVAAGLNYRFVAEVGSADGHDWIFVANSTADLFKGGVLMVDTDAGPATVAAVVADQSDDDQLQVNLPQGGTVVDMYCDGTYWIVSGTVVSTAAAVFS